MLIGLNFQKPPKENRSLPSRTLSNASLEVLHHRKVCTTIILHIMAMLVHGLLFSHNFAQHQTI
ncbi:MAG: hypothetical protein RL711_632 [Bacteroidota bacterium]